MGIFLEERIILTRQHLGMGVDVHSGSGSLFEQFFKVMEVMAGNKDSGVLAHADVDFGDLRVAVCACVG